MLDLVSKGFSWTEAFQRTYPNFIDKKKASARIDAWRNKNARFKELMARRKFQLGLKDRMSKEELNTRWLDIARFNLATLFEQREDGSVELVPQWLDEAKAHNVLKRITVTKKTIEAKDGSVITTETTDVVPYPADVALAKIGKLLGHDKTDQTPGNVKSVQQNNYYMIDRLNKVREAVKQEKLALPDGQSKAVDISPNLIERMMNAKIIKNGEEE